MDTSHFLFLQSSCFALDIKTLRYDLQTLTSSCSSMVLTGNAGCLMEKDLWNIRNQQVTTEFLKFWRCASHKFNGQFTLNLCRTGF